MSERPKLSAKKRVTLREELARQDIESLCLDEKFLRFIFTVLQIAGMFNVNYQPGGRDLEWLEGRRSLGLDMLAAIKNALGPDALTRILIAESKTQALTGGEDGRRNSSTDDGYDDRDDDDSGQPVADGPVLDYGPVRS